MYHPSDGLVAPYEAMGLSGILLSEFNIPENMDRVDSNSILIRAGMDPEDPSIVLERGVAFGIDALRSRESVVLKTIMHGDVDVLRELIQTGVVDIPEGMTHPMGTEDFRYTCIRGKQYEDTYVVGVRAEPKGLDFIVQLVTGRREYYPARP